MTENTNPGEAVPAAVTEEPNKKLPKEEVVSDTKMNDKKVQVKSMSGLLSLVAMVLSLPILASAIWLFYMKDYDCEKLLRLPKLQIEIAVGLLFLFLICNVALLFRSRFPIPAFFVVMPPLFVMLVMGLALVGAYKMENRRLRATPKWFREVVRDNGNWDHIKSCIYSTQTCDDLASRTINLKAFDFSLKKLSLVEFGCCRPPSGCGMEYVNATFWRRGDGYVDHSQLGGPDCNEWQNDPNILCYNCKSCKDGFVRLMQSKWRKLGVFFILMASLLIICHLLVFIAAMLERYKG